MQISRRTLLAVAGSAPIALAVERPKIAAIVTETGDVAQTFAATAGAVDDIHELQLNIASSVEEQSAVLAEVTAQLSTATVAAGQVLTGLQALSATSDR